MPAKKEPPVNRTAMIYNPEKPDSPYEGGLPPINMIVIPKGATQTLTIRWLFKVGYTVAEIHHYLGVRYQMVRNISHTVPKRAAREDLPPLIVHYKPEQDVISSGLDEALEQSMLAARKERQASQRGQDDQDDHDQERMNEHE